MRLVVAITGATGVIYGIRLLEILKKLDIETHLIISKWAQKIIKEETDYSPEYIKGLACYNYKSDNFNVPIASGSYKTEGMVVIPCSMKTLSSIAHGYAADLITRAADVAIKDKRKLILVPRETPLSVIHLENMLKLARLGVIILPPMPAFYYKPVNLEDIYIHTLSRILDQFGIDNHLFKRWGEGGSNEPG